MKVLWIVLVVYLAVGALLGYLVVDASSTAGVGEFITTMLAWPYLYFQSVS